MLKANGGSDEVLWGSSSKIEAVDAFTPEEAAIRDAYDHFLNGLERCGNYLEGNLLSVRDLKPYLEYWVTSIADTNCNGPDSLWMVFLLVYIEFYAFVGVQRLFDAFGYDIRVNGPLMRSFLAQSADHALAEAAVSQLINSRRPGQ
jgi:hypothetical protein